MPEELGVSHRIDADGILRVVFDRPGAKVNLLSAEILQGMGELLDDARGRDEVRGLLFTSGKPGTFLAGMDVDQIASVHDAYRGAEAARLGQAVFQRIADLGRPSACAIGGTCLGGGTELALACTFRIAADDRAVRIGLPEVQLGIIPGFGGTQRLPRLIGLTPALELILSGRQLDARRARQLGLVDLLVPEPYLEREALALLERAIREGSSRVVATLRRGKAPGRRLLERIGPLRNYVLEQARKRTSRKVEERSYPAPFRAIDAIGAAFLQPLPQGLDFEARLEGELITTSTSKNLIWLFKNQAALKQDGAGVRATPRRVARAAVFGAGIMGGGIAQLVADRGIPVRLKDLRYEAILTALSTAHDIWQRRLDQGKLDRHELAQKIAFIAPTLDDSGLRHVDLVVEAVVEDLGVKQKVLAEVERRIDQRAVFASNTSSLPIRDIASHAMRPERVVGLHFFNPVQRMPLVEVIAGSFSSPESVATAHAFAIKLGKVPVVVKDGPGFLINRILTFYLNEALRLLLEGVRIEALDSAMRAFGMPMGPFALLDQVGLDTASHVAAVLRAAFHERVEGTEAVLEALVGTGRRGQKNGRGFYLYKQGRLSVPDDAVYPLIGAPPVRQVAAETLQERLVLVMINEAALCLEEGVVRQPRDVDLGMVLGTGFPPFRGGLLRHADELGIPIVVDRLSRLADAHGGRFRPVGSLQEMVRQQRRFYPQPGRSTLFDRSRNP